MVWYGAPDSGTARDLRPVSLTGVCACGLCYDHLAPNRRRGGDNRELGRRGGPGDGRTGHDAVHCRLCDFVSCVLCVVVEASYVLCLTFFGKRRPTRAAFFSPTGNKALRDGDMVSVRASEHVGSQVYSLLWANRGSRSNSHRPK